MKAELQHAVTFLVDTLKDKLPNVSDDQLRTLRTRLTDLLAERYENHWYVDKPLKGSAFRCINICIEDHSIDLALRRAAHDGGISEKDIVSVFPNGLALWIDPDDVSGRMGKGAIFPIYKKIAENRTVVTEPATTGLQHRPQQRPRSISPPQSVISSIDAPPSTPISTSVSRLSKTPPGFRSLDAGQNFYTLPNQNNGRSQFPNNIQNLWRTQAPAPANTSTSQQMNTPRNPASYVSSNKYNSGDAVYSFNQYSSYYNAHFHWRKETPVSGGNAPQKSLWQDDSHQRTQWFRESNKNNSNKLSVAGNMTFNKVQNYAYGISRQVQEVY